MIGASKLNSSSSDESKQDTLMLGLFWMVCIACVFASTLCLCTTFLLRAFTCPGCDSAAQTLFGSRWSLHRVLAQEAEIFY